MYKRQGQKILVTSDSITFLKTIRKQKNYVSIIPGKVVHMNYTSEAEYKVYMESFIDLLMLLNIPSSDRGHVS